MPIDIVITTHVVTYAPWEDGADDREEIGTRTETETVTVYDLTDRNLSEFIVKRVVDAGTSENSQGLILLDEYEQVTARMWYAGEYEHPHSGELDLITVHIAGSDWTDDIARMAYIEWMSL